VTLLDRAGGDATAAIRQLKADIGHQ